MNKTIKIAILTAAALATSFAFTQQRVRTFVEVDCHYCESITHEQIGVPVSTLVNVYILSRFSYLEDQDSSTGWTMLHQIAEYTSEAFTAVHASQRALPEHVERAYFAARVYMQKRGNPDIKNNVGETALMMAVAKNNHRMVDILFGNRPLTADDFDNNKYPGVRNRFLAEEQDHIDRNNPIVAADANVQNDKGETALMYAARYANQEIYNLLIDNNADPILEDNDGNTALFHLAARVNYDADIAALLLNPRVNITAVNTAGGNILEHAINYNNVSLVDDITTLFAGEDALYNHRRNDGNTPLMLAAQLGRTAIVDLLIKRTQIYPYHINNRGRSAFLEAAYFGHADILRALYDRYGRRDGEIINSQYENVDVPQVIDAAYVDGLDSSGTSALLAAADGGHSAAVRFLLDIGADPNIQSCLPVLLVCRGTGNTPLLYAIKNGDSSSARDLLLADADLDLANNDGITPLILAASLGNFALVSGLLNNRSNNRANPFIADDNGLTALAHARSQNTENHRRIVDLLHKHIRGLQ